MEKFRIIIEKELPINVDWPVFPRRGELIFYDGKTYIVSKIRHDMDLNQINVYLNRHYK